MFYLIDILQNFLKLISTLVIVTKHDNKLHNIRYVLKHT